MRGEVVIYHLFDLGGTLDLAVVERGAGPRRPAESPSVGKGTPGYVEFPRPVVLGGPRVQVRGEWGTGSADTTLGFYSIGAVSVRFRVAIEVPDLGELHRFDASRVTIDGREMGFAEAARFLVDRGRRAWEPAIRDRYTKNVITESYTVFGFSEVGEGTEGFLERHGRAVAGLLAGEDGDQLHEKEVREALRKWFSYYTDDVIVIDWDAAFILDPRRAHEDLLFVLEIANLQLLQFRAYDDYLDDTLARGYDELALLHRHPFARRARRTAHELSLLQMEIAELADEADNITKFLGDWFLARVYEAAKEKFHLNQWRSTVDEKLGTLHRLYQIASQEGDSRRALVLELMIVLLFILDVILLFVVR